MISREVRRKLWATVLTASMVLSVTVCGVSADEGTGKDPFEPYEETVKIGLGQPLDLSIGGPDGGTYEDNAIKDYVEEKLNVEYSYEIEAIGDDYAQQLSLAMASEELPDVFQVLDRNTLDELVENDLVADLTHYWIQLLRKLKALEARQ